MGIEHVTVASNNHASPSGALPFLIPASPDPPSETPQPIPSNKLQHWAPEKLHPLEMPPNMRYEAYMSLLDTPIRNAWV